MSHVLHAYRVIVRRKRDNDARLLGNFDDSGADLLVELEAFFNDPARKSWLDRELTAAAEVDQVHAPSIDQPRLLTALVKAGEAGLVSEFRAVVDGAVDKKVAFRRLRDHVEFVTVLLAASLPGTRTSGFLIAHSPSGRGVKTRFLDTFRQWFGEKFPDYLVELDPCAPENFYKNLAREAALKRVTLVRSLRPSDRVAEDGRWFDDQALGRMTTVLAPVGRLASLRKQEFVEALDDDEKMKRLLVLHGETYDEIKTTFRQPNGREYSIVMSDEGMRTPRAGFDVTTSIEHDEETGEPTYESLRAATLDYLELLG